MSSISSLNAHSNDHYPPNHNHPARPGKQPSRKPLRFTGVVLVTALLLAAYGLMFLGCGGGGGGSLPGAVTETGTLSGRVSLPGDADPAGALVSATRMTADGTQPASAARPKAGRMLNVLQGAGGSYVTVADSEGYYTFEEVDKGGYYVVATKGAYKASQVIDVQPRVATIVDFTLTPTGTVYGRVILSGSDSSGGDMSGTMVLIKGTSYLAATDYAGYYTISQVPIGSDYQLMFARPGYETSEYTSPVSVSASAITTLDTVAMVVDFGQKGGLAGVAQRPAGAEHHEGILIAVLGTQYMAVTDVHGNWDIQGIPAGTYSLTFADLTTDFEELQITLDGIEVTAGAVETLDPVTLQPTGIAGTVHVQGGEAANGAMVQVQGLGQEGFDITGTDGSYEILGIDPGTYTVAAILTGYQPKIVENVQVQQGAMADLDFTLLPTGMEAGTGTVAGTVYVSGPAENDNGNLTPNQVDDPVPLARAYVALSGTNHFAVTDNQGAYTMINVPEGNYEIYVDVEYPGLEYRDLVGQVQVVANTTSTRNITVSDAEPPETDGPEGIVDVREVSGDGGAPAVRVFFHLGEDISSPVVYTVYYNDDVNWDQQDWDNNATLAVPQDQAGQAESGLLYADIIGVAIGTTYVFGVTAADSWGNEGFNGISLMQQVVGTDDVYHPVWSDSSRSGVQTAYATDTDGEVALEFEDATDDYGDGRPATPPISFRVYYAPVTEWDGQDWLNNETQDFAENLLKAGSYYTNKVILNGLTPGIPYTFGVRVRDSADPANEDVNHSVRLATPAGSLAGDPAKLAFGMVPPTVLAGETWTTFGVAVTDDKGVVVPEADHSITISLQTGSNDSGLDGTLTRTAQVHEISGQTIKGTALFDDVSYSADLFDLPETIVIEAAAQDLAGATVEVRVEASDLTGDAVINEVVFDPENDWNESTGGNQAAFDDHPGYGTVDVGDSYIELKNTSGQALDVSGWHIGVFDIPDADPGSNSPPVFTALGSAPVFLSQGTLQSWPDGAYLAAGGVQGISSTVLSGCFVIVFNGNPATGSPERVAEAAFGDFNDGNAGDNAPALTGSGKADEAVCLNVDGNLTGTDASAYVKRFATPGAPNAPTDTKPPLYMGTPGIHDAGPVSPPGSIQVVITQAYDTASEPVSYNAYYALEDQWNGSDWGSNQVILGITTESGNAFHANLKGFTPGESYTIGIRAQDAANPANEDSNTATRTATAQPWPDSDGDGIPDNEDDSPDDAAVSTPDSATGTGKVEINVSGTTGAKLAAVESIDPDSQDVPQTGRPVDYAFPDGLVSFNVQGVTPGKTVQVSTTWPSPIPKGAVYYKVDDTGFHAFNGASFDGNTVTLTLTDGGAGDADGTINGVIDDPGGVALPVVASNIQSATGMIAPLIGSFGLAPYQYVRAGDTSGDGMFNVSYSFMFKPTIQTGQGFDSLSFSFPAAHTGWGQVTVPVVGLAPPGVKTISGPDTIQVTDYSVENSKPGQVTVNFDMAYNAAYSEWLFLINLAADAPPAPQSMASCEAAIGATVVTAGPVSPDIPSGSMDLAVVDASAVAELSPVQVDAGATAEEFNLDLAPLLRENEGADTVTFAFPQTHTGWGSVTLNSAVSWGYAYGQYSPASLDEGTHYSLVSSPDGTMSVQILSPLMLSLLSTNAQGMTFVFTVDTPVTSQSAASCTVALEGPVPPTVPGTAGDITLGQGTASLDVEVQGNAGSVQFDKAQYTIGEQSASVTVTVNRAGGADGVVTVNYERTGGSATPGTDFTLAAGTLTWNNGETGAKTFSVTIIDDSVDDDDETVVLGLSGAAGGVAVGSLDFTTITITDDDLPPAPAILSAVADDPDDGDNYLSVGDTLTITFDQDTSAATGPVTETDVSILIDIGSKFLGQDYAGNWTSKSVLVITITDNMRASLVPGDSLDIKPGANLTNAAGTSAASSATATITGDWGTGPGIPHHLEWHTAPPVSVSRDVTWDNFMVGVYDEGSALVVNATGTVALSVTQGSSTLRGGSTSATVTNGVAVFSGLNYPMVETIVIAAASQDLLGVTAEVDVVLPTLTGDAVINEVVFDPENDWNESTGGNQAAFDNHPGYGAADGSDSYIELKNVSGQTLDVSGWVIGVQETPGSTPVYTAIGSAPVYLPQGTLNSWPNGTHLVAGAVQGVTSTAVSGCMVTVFAGDPEVITPDRVDEVMFGEYDDGNMSDNAPDLVSSGKTGEAVCLDDDGVKAGDASTDYVKRFATPGAENTAADTLAPLWKGILGGAQDAQRGATPGTLKVMITEAYDTAHEPVAYNVYFAESGSWNNSNWSANTVISNATVLTDPSLHVVIDDLTPGGEYIVGVRAQDSASQPNEDTNIVTRTGVAANYPDTDGDGILDNVDDSPQDAAVATPETTTGTGKIGVDVSGAAGAQLAEVKAVDPDSQDVNQAGRPADRSFPDGLVAFKVQGISPGATVQVVTTWPSDVPDGAAYYKVDDTGFNAFAGAAFDGNTITLTLTDGGAGDADGNADGVITDPGGVAYPVVTGGITSVAAEIATAYNDSFIQHQFLPAGAPSNGLYSYHLAFAPVMSAGQGFQTLTFSFPSSHAGWGTVTVESMQIDDGAGGVTQVDSGTYTPDTSTAGTVALQFDTPFNATRSGHVFSLKLKADAPSAGKPLAACRLLLGTVQASADDVHADLPHDSLSLEVVNGSGVAEITPSLTAAGAAGQQFTLYLAPLVKAAEQVDTIKFAFHSNQTGWGAVSVDSFTVTTYDDGENIVPYQEGTDYTLGTSADGSLSVQITGGIQGDFNVSLLTIGIAADAPTQGFASESCSVWFDGTTPPSLGAVEGDITGGQNTSSLDVEVADASTLAAITVSDFSEYWASATYLSATWQVTNGVTVQEYQYAIGTTSGGTDVRDWTSTGTTASVTADGLTLQDGQEYFFAVKGQNQVGLWSTPSMSDGVTVWATAPAIAVSDDGEYTSISNVLNASWQVTNSVPVTHYQYAIGTTSGGTDVVGWTSTGTTASMSRTGLTLQDAQAYYISVKASNPAGAWTDPPAVSDGITYAAIPQLAGVVFDDPDDSDNYLSIGDTLTITFDRDTIANAGPITKTDVDSLIDIGNKSLGTDYAGNWTSKSVLVITIADASAGTLAPGDTLAIKASAGISNAAGTSTASSSSASISGDLGTGPGIPHHLAWVTAPPVSVVRETAWADFAVGVYDVTNVLVNNATGTAALTVTQGNNTLGGGSTSVSLTNGAATFSGITYATAETIVIRADSGQLIGVTAEVHIDNVASMAVADGSWHDTNTWDGAIPGANDEAVTIQEHAITHSDTGVTSNLGRLSLLAGDLTLSGGTITTTDASTVDSDSQFTLSGGTLGGTGALSIPGSFVFDTGTISGTGDVTASGQYSFGNTGTRTLDGKLTLAADGSLMHRSIAGSGTLENTAALDLEGSCTIAPAVTNAAAATLSMQGTSSYGDAWITVTGAVSNAGTLVFDDVNTSSNSEAHLTTNGGLTNTGTLHSRTTGGTGGTPAHEITAAVTNTGTMDIDHNLTIINAGKNLDSSSGTIDIADGEYLTIAPGSGQSGQFTVGSGTTLSGTGSIRFYHTVTVNADSDFTFTSDSPSLVMGDGHVIFDGGSTFTIAHGKELVFHYDDDLAAGTSLVNQGGLRFRNNYNEVNGTFSNASGAVMVVEGASNIGDGYATFADGFANAGTIVLDNSDPAAAREGFLTVTSGALANTGTIQSANSGEYGNTGDHKITGAITNNGTIDVDHDLVLAAAAKTIDSSAGTIDVDSGATLFIAPGSGQTGTLLVGSDTSLTGTGTIWFYHTVNFNTASDFTLSGTVPVFEMKDAHVIFGGGNTFTVGDGTELIMHYDDDLAADTTLVNQGTVRVRSSYNELDGTFSNASGGTLAVEGEGSNDGYLNVAEGFTSAGTITLDNVNDSSAREAHLTVESGTLTNTGTILSDNAGGYGSTAYHDIHSPITNTGTIDVDHDLMIRSSVDTSGGVIDIVAGEHLLFDPYGSSVTLTVGDGSTLTGGGTMRFVDTVNFNAASDFTYAAGAPVLNLGEGHIVFGGGNTFTVASGQELLFDYDDDLAADTTLANQGTVRVRSSNNAFDGPFSNAAGASLVIEGEGSNDGYLTVAAGFTSAGTITMDNVNDASAREAHLTVSSGPLANTGTIQSVNSGGYGSTAYHDLHVPVTNTGTIDVDHDLMIRSSVDTSEGVIDVADGEHLLFDPYGSSVTVTVGDASTLVGTGTLRFVDTVNFNAATDFTFAASAPALNLGEGHIVFGGGNTFTVASGRELLFDYDDDLAADTTLVNQGTVRIRSSNNAFDGPFSNASGASLVIEGEGSNDGYLTVAAGFTSAGTITMDNVNDTSAREAHLTVSSGTLANTGTILSTNSGGYGSTAYHDLHVGITNTGTIDVDHDLMIRSSVDTSEGVIDVADGEHLLFDPYGSSVTVTVGDTSTLVGTGTLRFVDTVNFNSAAAFTFATDGPALNLGEGHVVFGGGGTFTVAAGRELLFAYDDDLAAGTTLTNQGTVRVRSANNEFDGAFSIAAGASLIIEGEGSNSGYLTVADGFTSAGTIVLDNVNGSTNRLAHLTVESGTITSSGTILVDNSGGYGSTGEHKLYAGVTSTGTMDLDHNLRAYYIIDSSSGVMDIADGKYLIMDPAGASSTLTVSGTSGFTGTGTLKFADTVYFNAAGDLTLGATSPTVDMSGGHVILGGGNTITVASGGSMIFNSDDDIADDGTTLVNQGTVTIQNTNNEFAGLYTNAAGSTLLLDGDPTTSSITFNGGASNAGTITMWGDYYSTYITVGSGETLTNTGTINFGGTTSGGNRITGSVTNQGTIDVTVDSLEMVNTNATFDTSGGDVTVAAGRELVIKNGTTTFGTDTVLTGDGTIYLQEIQTLSLASDFTYVATMPDIYMDGTVTVSGAGSLINDGDLRLRTNNDVFSAAVTNNADATLTLDAGPTTCSPTFNAGLTNNGTLTLWTDYYSAYVNLGADQTLVNTGTINNNANTGGDNYLNGAVTNTGTIHVTGDDMRINNAGAGLVTSAGTLSVDSGRTLTISDGTTSFGGSTVLAGAGTINLINTHTLDIGTGYTHNTETLDLHFGGAVTVSGTGTFTNNGQLNLETTDDALNVAVVNNAAKTLVIDAGANTSTQHFNNSLTNNGTLTFNGTYYTATLNMGTDQVLTNTGTINMTGNTGGGNALNGEVVNTGTIDATVDDMKITNAGDGLTTSAGTLNVADGRVLEIANGTTTFGDGTDLTGDGRINLSGTHILNLASNYSHDTTTADLYFGGAVTVSGAGTFTNNGTINLQTTDDVFAVAVTNNATRSLVIDANGNHSSHTFNAGLTNNGTITLSSTYYNPRIYLGSGQTLTNTGTITQAGNTGGEKSISGAITNTGTINAAVDHMHINNADGGLVTSNGTLAAAEGMIMVITGGTTTFGDGTTLSGDGQININGTHTLALASDYTHATTTVDLYLGGDVTVNGAGSFINDGAIKLRTTDDEFDVAVVNNATKTLIIDAGPNHSSQYFNSSFTNSGTLTFNSDNYNARMYMAAGQTLTNTGTITLTGNTGGENSITGAITNTGTINAAVDHMHINNADGGLVTSNGTLAATEGMIMVITGGTTTFGSGTTLSGDGQINIYGTHTLALASDYTHATTTVDLYLGGDVTVNGSGSFINDGAIKLRTTDDEFDVAVVNNAAKTLVVDADTGNSTQTFNSSLTNNGTLELFSDQYTARLTMAAGQTLTNVGTITVGGNTSGDNYITGAIANTGTIEADVDHLYISNADGGLVTSAGILSAAASRVLSIDGGTTTFGSSTTLSGEGQINLSGTHILNLATDYSHDTTTADLNFGGVVTVSGSGIFTNNGLLSLESADDQFSVAVVNNTAKTLTINADTGNSTQTFNAALTNNGTLELFSDQYTARITMAAGQTLTNAGTITMGGNSSGDNYITGAITNTGTVEADIDHLYITNADGGLVTSAGTLSAAAEKVLSIDSGTTTFGSGTTLSGDGQINLSGTHTLSLATDYTHGTTTADLNFGGVVTVSGSGTFINDGLLNLESTDDQFSVAMVNNAARTLTIDADYGNSTQTFNNSLTNNGFLKLLSDQYAARITMAAGQTLTNAGTISLAGNTSGDNYITGAITNTGTIEADIDDLSITNADGGLVTSAGTLSAASGRTLSISGGTTSFGSGTTLSGEGKIDLAGTHTLNMASDYSHDTTTADLHFSGIVTVSGTGTFTNNGELHLETDNDQFDVAVVNNAARTLVIDADYGTSTQTFNSSLTNNGILALFSDQYTANLTMDTGQTLTNNDTIITTGNSSGSNVITGAVLNGGTIELPYVMSVSGTLTSGTSSLIKVYATNSSSYTYLNVTTLDLSGTGDILHIEFDAGYTPVDRHTFTIIQNATGGITGTFESLTHNLGGDWILEQTVNADNIVITLRPFMGDA